VLLVLRLEVEGALPEPGRWGDEWNAPLMTMCRRGLVTCAAVNSDQIRSEHQAGTALSCVCVCCWRQTGPTWVFNPRREGGRLLVLLAAGDVGRIVGDEFVCGG
jgi:hypothetical protein